MRTGSIHATLTLVILLLAMSTLVACGPPPLPTPTVFALIDPSPSEMVPESRRMPTNEVIYFTDRVPAVDHDQKYLHYTSGRSRSRAFGVATVDLGAASWEQLVDRSNLSRPTVIDVIEHARFAPTPIPLVGEGDDRVPDPVQVAESRAVTAEFHALLESMMVPEDQGRVTVFVHGFNVNFESAVITAAALSELTGRRGVMIAYSWPAGSGSMLRGYTHDRESGEFSVFHLRETLREIADSPHVRRLNLVAHSRGTDVLTTAIREINLEERGAGRTLRETLKLGHVILAAPDLDLEVVSQRIAAEYLYQAPISTTIYVSPTDRALGIANWLFAGVRRLGGLKLDKLDPETRRVITDAPPEVEIVDVRSHPKGLGHSYFHQCPAVSSDLYLILVEDRRVGGAHGRPLQQLEDGGWRLHEGYPLGWEWSPPEGEAHSCDSISSSTSWP